MPGNTIKLNYFSTLITKTAFWTFARGSNGMNFFMTIGAKKFIPMISKMFNIKNPYGYVCINDEHDKIEESDKSITNSFNPKELDNYRFLIGKLRA
jgi:hypothetical protein